MTQPSTDPAAPDPEQPKSSFPKQAIVVVHGMGEQRPMDTITGFARSVWSDDKTVWQNGMPSPGHVWSKPDSLTGSLELRRLTTRQSTPSPKTFPNGSRQDFFELYWADLSGGSTLDEVENWVCMLLFRNPFTNVPPRVLSAWLLLWVVVSAIVILLVAGALPKPTDPDAPFLWQWIPFVWLQSVPRWLLLAAGAALGWLAHNFLVPYFGRVVRYSRATPDNIAARAAIRKRGLDLLTSLHNANYDRIILVSHSLGTLVAYDLVSYFWASHFASHTIQEGTDEFRALCSLEELAALMAAESDDAKRDEQRTKYRDAQRVFARLLRLRPQPASRWLITDFITVGCPLGHADFLLAKDAADRERRIGSREFATCPPLRETLDPGVPKMAERAGLPVEGESGELFCFPLQDAAHHVGEWQLHHAAHFAAMRWTNIHDPSFAVFFGDVISTPVAPIFGHGVLDIDLKKLRGKQSWRFTHLDYWKEGGANSQSLVELRAAIDMAAKGNP